MQYYHNLLPWTAVYANFFIIEMPFNTEYFVLDEINKFFFSKYLLGAEYRSLGDIDWRKCPEEK